VERNALIEALSGGYIEHYELDLRRKALVLRVEMLNGETLSSYEIRCELLSFFAYDTESRSDSDARLQLTELSINAAPGNSPSEEWDITISIFDMSHIQIRCSTIVVDGQTLR
jgi:hypothetical protein